MDCSMSENDLQLIKVQFKALGLIGLAMAPFNPTSKNVVWSLTPKGEKAMMEILTVRRGD